MRLVSESWLGVEFYFITGPLEWGAHEPPSFIVNQRQGERKRRRQQNRTGVLSAATPLRTGRPRRAGGHLALLGCSLMCDKNII
jgi:hypothetical protein